MPSPIWLDAAGRPLPTLPCPRCGLPVPIQLECSLEAARALGWVPCQRHGTELLPSPWSLLPVVERETDEPVR